MVEMMLWMGEVNVSRKEEETFEKRVGEGGFPTGKRELSALPK